MSQLPQKRRSWIGVWLSFTLAGCICGCGTLQWEGRATKSLNQTHPESVQNPIVLSIQGPTLERYKRKIVSRLRWLTHRPVQLDSEKATSLTPSATPLWIEIQETADRYEDSLEPQWAFWNPFQFDPAFPYRSMTPYGDTSYYYLKRLPGPRHLVRIQVTIRPGEHEKEPPSPIRSRTFWVEEPYLVDVLLQSIRALLR